MIIYKQAVKEYSNHVSTQNAYVIRRWPIQKGVNLVGLTKGAQEKGDEEMTTNSWEGLEVMEHPGLHLVLIGTSAPARQYKTIHVKQTVTDETEMQN